MSFRSLLDCLTPRRNRRRPPPRPRDRGLAIEALEDRCTPSAMLTIGSVSVLEGNAGARNAVVTVSVTEPHSNALSVNYGTADGTATAGSDYNAISGTLTFTKNEMSKTILVPVFGDRVPEPNESFFVRLDSPKGAKIAKGEGNVTIVDDEPRISINNASLVEGNTGSAPMSFTVSLSAASDLPVTVNYATANRSAQAGTDYTAASGTLVFEPGQTTQTINVLVTGDQTAELNKSFSVNLSTPDSHAAISDMGVGVGTIIDDEPLISIADVYNYGETTFTFTVSLSAASNQTVTVNFATVDVTMIAGVDYVASSGTLSFAPGETTKTITVDVLDPTSVDTYFYVQLSGASANAQFANDWAIGYSNYIAYSYNDSYDYDSYTYWSNYY